MSIFPKNENQNEENSEQVGGFSLAAGGKVSNTLMTVRDLREVLDKFANEDAIVSGFLVPDMSGVGVDSIIVGLSGGEKSQTDNSELVIWMFPGTAKQWFEVQDNV